jgi:membrane protease YdiL (CAAX protease family)
MTNERQTKRGVILAFAAYIIQVPILLGGIQGWLPVHPIVILPPLLGLINKKIEERGLDGLGLTLPHPLRSLALALILTATLALSYVHIFTRAGVAVALPQMDRAAIAALAQTFLIAVFVIALWEEFTCRGYIQTRLQEAWGFRGVVLSTLMFASLHLPSAVLEFAYAPRGVLLHLLEMTVRGFTLAIIYWRTRSTPTTIAVHGLRNVAFTIAAATAGLTAGEMHLIQPGAQLLWRAAEALLAWALARWLFNDAPTTEDV